MPSSTRPASSLWGQLFPLLLAACLVACTPGSPDSARRELVIFAAASLTDALTEIGQEFEAAHPGVKIVFNFSGSSRLAAQISQGGAADLFASANAAQMQKLVEAGHIAGGPIIFATNRLVIIVPADNPAGVRTAADLAQPGLRLVLALPDVPVRNYTDQMVAAMAADAAYGPGFADALYANLASEEEDVRQVAAKVALGEADAGVVYRSDITPEIVDRITRIEVPSAFTVTAVYPIARVAGGAEPALAEEFIRTLRGAAGQRVLARWGLGAPPRE